MPIYRKKIWAGDVYEVEEFFSPRKVGKKYERGMNENLTTEEQKKRNLQQARKKLTRLINANFGGKDYFLLVTHDNLATVEEAKKEIRNFFRRLARWRKKEGLSELKYISVVETQGRIHHHIVMNGLEGKSMKEAQEILQSIWGKGLVLIKRLQKNQPENRLANYITKENVDKGKKRWTTSRNLQKPKVKLEQVTERATKRRIAVPKGYTLIRKSENFFDGCGWVRYIKAIRDGGYDFGEGEEVRRGKSGVDKK